MSVLAITPAAPAIHAPLADANASATNMTKSQVVAAIRRLNMSASREWLESFDFRALEGYLARLHSSVFASGRGQATASDAAAA